MDEDEVQMRVNRKSEADGCSYSLQNCKADAGRGSWKSSSIGSHSLTEVFCLSVGCTNTGLAASLVSSQTCSRKDKDLQPSYWKRVCFRMRVVNCEGVHTTVEWETVLALKATSSQLKLGFRKPYRHRRSFLKQESRLKLSAARSSLFL